MDKKLLSQNEVAELIGVHANTIKNWREAKLLSFFRAPGSRRPFYFKEDVEAFIKKHTKGTRILNAYKPTAKVKAQKASDEDWRIE